MAKVAEAVPVSAQPQGATVTAEAVPVSAQPQGATMVVAVPNQVVRADLVPCMATRNISATPDREAGMLAPMAALDLQRPRGRRRQRAHVASNNFCRRGAAPAVSPAARDALSPPALAPHSHQDLILIAAISGA